MGVAGKVVAHPPDMAANKAKKVILNDFAIADLLNRLLDSAMKAEGLSSEWLRSLFMLKLDYLAKLGLKII